MVFIDQGIYFLLSEFIWSVTWGIYLLPISAFFFFLLLKVSESMSILRSLIIAFCSHFCALALFSFIIAAVVLFVSTTQYTTTAHYGHLRISRFSASLYLSFIYTFLELFFFLIIQKKMLLPLSRIFILLVMSNSLAAICTYVLFPKF